jgi:hypothetical protein
MPLPETHIQERLSVAYVSAVVSRAGYVFWLPPATEYGTDGMIQKVYYTNGTYCGAGDGVFIQIKATVDYAIIGESIHYEMEVSAFNKLARRLEDDAREPILLILYCMPRDHGLWLENDQDRLFLRHCCYWKHVTERPSNNRRSFTIQIPRSQQLNIGAVEHIYQTYRKAALYKAG